MKPGYSKILISGNVIPKTKAHWDATGLDMVIIAPCSSAELTAVAWCDLIETWAGLKICKVWGAGEDSESLIECERA
ncbi:putative O-methyltransferase [Talaromyces proteolyticus]|uniref:O-methyltransferase n=1 Tax=Talaromyces proteolyticus TaxID=1131652 RepID=A0AAD4KYQ1_9EURO|nr:putative O-methyltransferase [Talaromyces proteolyticus]KAH8703417.1 putative O-methyltransferase [Talaromyces proteolyticus]